MNVLMVVSFIFFAGLSSAEAYQGKHSLPDVNDLTQGSRNLLQQITKQLSTLQDHIDTAKVEGAEALRVRASDYEARLAAERDEIAELEREYPKLKEKTEAARSSNKELRMAAEDFSQANKLLLTDLRAMKWNLSIAMEFVSKAFQKGLNVHTAPELAVLHEVREQEASDVPGEGDEKPSLLQVDTSPVLDETHDVLRSLTASLELLVQDEKASFDRLGASFTEELNSLLEQKAAVIARNAELNATLVYETDMNKRLEAAVKYLKDMHHHLSHSSKALRIFGSRLGAVRMVVDSPVKSKKAVLLSMNRDVNKSAEVSLLQTIPRTIRQSVNESRELDISHVAHTAHQLFEELQASIADSQSSYVAAVEERIRVYNKVRLPAQQVKLASLMKKLGNLTQSIAAVRSDTLLYRGMLTSLAEQNKEALANINSMASNLSTALAVAQLASDDYTRDSQNTTVLLAALRDLVTEVAEPSAGVTAVMLQVDASKPPSRVSHKKPSSRLLLSHLASTLDNLQSKQTAAVDELEASLKAKYDEGEANYSKLLFQQKQLQDKFELEVELNKQVKATFLRLQEARQTLLKRSLSLRVFARSLAALPLPGVAPAAQNFKQGEEVALSNVPTSTLYAGEGQKPQAVQISNATSTLDAGLQELPAIRSDPTSVEDVAAGPQAQVELSSIPTSIAGTAIVPQAQAQGAPSSIPTPTDAAAPNTFPLSILDVAARAAA